ncbi:MAG: 3-isopropylmalate dehydratase small subunit [Pseudomonadota bacterium]
MSLKGKVWKFGDDINTDEIIPAKYLNTADPAKLAEHVMEGIDASFPSRVRPGDVIVAGKNFGCGSSREHAPVAIKGAGVSCVIAKSFARIFFRNAFNTGLLILEAPGAVDGTNEGDALEVDPQAGSIVNRTVGATHGVNPIPPFMKELLEDGGLIPHIKKIRSRNN